MGWLFFYAQLFAFPWNNSYLVFELFPMLVSLIQSQIIVVCPPVVDISSHNSHSHQACYQFHVLGEGSPGLFQAVPSEVGLCACGHLSSFTSLPCSPVGMVSSIEHLFFLLVLSLILLGHVSNSSLEKCWLEVDLLKLYLSKYIFILSLPLFGNLVVRLSISEIITKNFEGIASFQSLPLPSGAGVELSRATVVGFCFCFFSLWKPLEFSLALILNFTLMNITVFCFRS